MNGRQVQVRVPTENTGGLFDPGADVIIGRADDAQVTVRDLRVSRHHAVLRLDAADGWVLEDRSSRGMFIDGRQVRRLVVDRPYSLRLGDPYDGVVVEVALAPSSPAPPAAASGGTGEAPGMAAGAGPPVPVAPAPGAPAPGAPAMGGFGGGRVFPAPPADPTLPPLPAAGPPPPGRTGPPGGLGATSDSGGPARSGPMPPGGISAPRDAEPDLGGAGVAFSSVYRPTGRFRIGRGEENDIVVADLLVSRQHAELRNQNGSYQIVDLGSHNGTYVDGRRVTRAEVTERSVVTIGHHLFRLHNGRFEEYIDRGQASFAAVDLSVQAGAKTLLNGVSFALGASAFLAVLGPTGAGKSTLVKALTGSRPADQGHVLYNGRDLYQAYPELRHRIGYVPQDDILHLQLTVRQALGYAARLRFPTDVNAEERHDRVDEVMAELGLTARADLQVLNLSGGQRKRVSVAIELLTRPSLILLDEPTSGLDPGYEKSVMALLRTLADSGRTVITVTHSIQSLDLCDRVLFLAPGGDLAYFGPPDEALSFFTQPHYADVFQLLDRSASGQARAAFAQSPLRQLYVDLPLASYGNASAAPLTASGGGAAAVAVLAPAGVAPASGVDSRNPPGLLAVVPAGFAGGSPVGFVSGGGPPGPPSGQFQELGVPGAGGEPPRAGPLGGGPLGVARPNAKWGHQLVSLLRRYLAVILADRRNTLLLLLQAPLLGLLMLVVLGAGHLRPGPTGQGASTTVLVALTLSATYLGATNSIREIVKERAILTRERSVGLSGSAYVVSKALLLGALTVIQSVILVLLATARQHGPGHGVILSSGMIELLVVVSLTGLAAMALGLMISAFVNNPDKALTLLPLLLFAEFLLSGGALNLGHNPAVRDIGYLTGARWGEAAASATVNVDALLRDGCNHAPSPVIGGVLAPAGGHSCNADFRHTSAAWGTDMIWLLLLTAVPLGFAVVAIRPVGQPRRK